MAQNAKMRFSEFLRLAYQPPLRHHTWARGTQDRGAETPSWYTCFMRKRDFGASLLAGTEADDADLVS